MLKIGGLQKLTLVDSPGNLAATVFLIGCNFLCRFCYAAELVLPKRIQEHPIIPEKEFFKFLKEKKGLLEGVVVCGGEPTIHKDLPNFIKKIKKLRYLVKLDTNGSNPEMLRGLINKQLIDYVAMDIKAPKEKYAKVTGRKISFKNVEKSIEILKESDIDYEFRTTVVPNLLKKEDILKIVHWISPTKKYFLQNFRPEKTIDPKFEKVKSYPTKYLLEIKKAISPFFEECQIR